MSVDQPRLSNWLPVHADDPDVRSEARRVLAEAREAVRLLASPAGTEVVLNWLPEVLATHGRYGPGVAVITGHLDVPFDAARRLVDELLVALGYKECCAAPTGVEERPLEPRVLKKVERLGRQYGADAATLTRCVRTGRATTRGDVLEPEKPHSLGYVGSMYTDVHAWRADKEAGDDDLVPLVFEDGPAQLGPADAIDLAVWRDAVVGRADAAGRPASMGLCDWFEDLARDPGPL